MKAVFFDLDGTLTDSGEGIINCAILALEHFGLPIPSREALRVFVGPPLDQSFINHGVPADKADEAIRVYRSRYTTVGKFENSNFDRCVCIFTGNLANLRKYPHWLV